MAWGASIIVIETAPPESALVLSLSFAFFVILGWLSISIWQRKNLMRALTRFEIADERMEPLIAFSSPFFLISAFTIVSYQLHTFNPTLFEFTANESARFPEVTEWTIYAFDQVVRAIFLDVLETFYWQVSYIKYSDVWWLKAFVLTFKTILTVVFWSTVIGFYRERREIRQDLEGRTQT